MTLPEKLSGEEWLSEQTRKVFHGIAALAASELKATSDEFQLLEQVNRVASAKYAELADSVESLESVSQELIEQRKLFFECTFLVARPLPRHAAAITAHLTLFFFFHLYFHPQPQTLLWQLTWIKLTLSIKVFKVWKKQSPHLTVIPNNLKLLQTKQLRMQQYLCNTLINVPRATNSN